jgi:hypothetical protein
MTREQISDEIRQRLGYRRLSRAWAKLEILLGLLAGGVGLFLGCYALSRPAPEWEFVAPALALFVLGGYLTLAGHRSHLYQADHGRLVLLIEELRRQPR